MLLARIAIFALSSLSLFAAQDDPGLAAAKALDDEILKLNALSPEARPRAIHAALAFNLLADSSESDGRDALQDVARAMVEAIHISPARYLVEIRTRRLHRWPVRDMSTQPSLNLMPTIGNAPRRHSAYKTSPAELGT